MSKLRINFIPFGNVKDGQCVDAEAKIGEICCAENCDLVSITPFMLAVPGQPLMDSTGNITAMAPRMIPGFVLITDTKDTE